MKSLTLSIAERLAAISIFNNTENRVSTENLKIYLNDVDKFRLTEEDKKACNWTEVKNEQGQITQFTWDGALEKTIEIEEFTAAFLAEKLKKLEVSAADPFALPISMLIEKVC